MFVFNSSTGSDTAASGAGPATALTGSNASFSGSVITLDGSPDLSAVATDGTHAIYLLTSTGRKFFDITAKDNVAKTVTVGNAPAGTSTGRTWAIGGKRATFNETNSRQLFQDVKATWEITTETDQAITGSAITIAPLGFPDQCCLRSEGTTHRVISQSANTNTFTTATNATGWAFRTLRFTNTNATKTSAIAMNLGGAFTVENCIFGDGTNHFDMAISVPNAAVVSCYNCYFNGQRAGSTSGIINLGSSSVQLYGCWFRAQAGPCVRFTSDVVHLLAWHCVFDAPAGDAIVTANPFNTAGPVILLGNTFNGGSADGVDMSSARLRHVVMLNNNISGFAGVGQNGVRAASSQNLHYQMFLDGNNFFNNTSNRLNFPVGASDQSLDPAFPGSPDFTPGSNLRRVGWPAAASVRLGANQATLSYPDIGAVQHQDAGGGSGGMPLIGGGLIL